MSQIYIIDRDEDDDVSFVLEDQETEEHPPVTLRTAVESIALLRNFLTEKGLPLDYLESLEQQIVKNVRKSKQTLITDYMAV